MPPSPFAMFLFDPKRGTIVATNHAAARLYGFSEEEFLDRTVAELCPNLGRWKRAHEFGKVVSGRMRQRRSDGSSFDAEVIALEDAGPVGPRIMVMVQPLHALPAVALVDRGTKSSPATGAARSEHVGTHSHTLRGGAPRRVWDGVRLVGVEAEGRMGRAGRLCEASLDRRSFAPESTAALIENVLASLREQIDARSLEVEVDCTKGSIRVHAEAFSQALYELLANAVHASDPGYLLMIGAHETGGGDTLISLQDAGCGMASEELADLGHPVFSERGELSRIGVALAWSVVDNHGGLIRYESARGVGTTVDIWLP